MIAGDGNGEKRWTTTIFFRKIARRTYKGATEVRAYMMGQFVADKR